MAATVLRLWPSAEAPGEARSALRASCSGLPGDVVDTACLLVSELVTNAYRHAQTTVTVAIATDREHVSVAVHDDDPVVPEVTESAPPPPEQEGGRGLFLLGALANRFGVETDDDGKTLWFRLP